MRRGVVGTLTALLMLAFVMPVNADPLTTVSDEHYEFRCDLTGDAGFGSVFVEVFSSSLFGDTIYGEAEIWLPGGAPEDLPDLWSFSDLEGARVEVMGDQVAATFPMIFGGTEDPFGDLTITGTVGDLIDEETDSGDRFWHGNSWTELSFIFQVFDASADVSLASVQFNASCSATRVQIETRATNPHSTRVDFSEGGVSCASVAESDSSLLELNAYERNEAAGDGHGDAFLSLWIFPAESDGFFLPELIGDVELPRLSGNINVTVPLFAVPEDFYDSDDPFPGPGDEPATEAEVSMTIEEGEVVSSNVILAQHYRQKRVETELMASGAVGLVGGRSYDLDDCIGSRFEAKGLSNESEGPRESGEPPVNDRPEGALPLALGQHANQETKAAGLQPESSCTVFDDLNGEFDEPIGKTLWYTVTGTGEPITVSTTGSQFDTIVGVYTLAGQEGFEQVACVDDVPDNTFTLQAIVTFDSEPGVTYFVQAGGFGLFEDLVDPQFNSMPEYGLLKISVSG